MTIGACATAGGIQALRNFGDVEEFTRAVYARPEFISTLATSTPIRDHVRVDFELRGCPISKGQLVELVSSYLGGRQPNVPTESVCIECKRRGNVCVLVAHGTPCLGPVTETGLRRDLPGVPRGLLRVLRPAGQPERPLADQEDRRARHDGAGDPARLPNVQRRRAGLPRGQRGDGGEEEMTERTVTVDYLAHVEGEGALNVRIKDQKVEECQLKIFEPPRFFEAFLRGRSYKEAPDITARICGICPVAYQMSSCHAMEKILGIHVEGQLRELRRLLYCGEWIESHPLHIYLLHAPDFLGYPDADPAREGPPGGGPARASSSRRSATTS